jgi:hypothetical protein
MFEVAAALACVATIIFVLFVDESNEHADGTGVRLVDHAPFPAR